jgi:hypothetical protein
MKSSQEKKGVMVIVPKQEEGFTRKSSLSFFLFIGLICLRKTSFETVESCLFESKNVKLLNVFLRLRNPLLPPEKSDQTEEGKSPENLGQENDPLYLSIIKLQPDGSTNEAHYTTCTPPTTTAAFLTG